MGEKKQIFLIEEFQIIYVDDPSRRWSLTPPLPPLALPTLSMDWICDVIPKVRVRKGGEEINLRLEKSGKYLDQGYYHQWQVTLMSCTLWYDVMRRMLHLFGILPQTL